MIPSAWEHLQFFKTDWPRIEATLAADPRRILPPAPERFAALNHVAPLEIRVVILGQDPYPTVGHAHGHAFSVEPNVRPLPRSLSNIFRELQEDVGVTPTSGDLRPWARQGVLLLNTSLSVPEGQAGAHAKLGWHRLAEEILAEVSRRPTAFLLWGAHAQSLKPLIQHGDHLIIESAHPSPLSARRGFFGSRPFSRVNEWLAARRSPPIDWSGRQGLSLNESSA